MKSMFASSFTFMALLGMFNSMQDEDNLKNIEYFIVYFSFEGRVVAKLPFEPIPWIRGLSHRNLSGDDFTDCSFIFLYVLCTMSIRQVKSIQPDK